MDTRYGFKCEAEEVVAKFALRFWQKLDTIEAGPTCFAYVTGMALFTCKECEHRERKVRMGIARLAAEMKATAG